MANPILLSVPRQERRALLAAEAHARRTAVWTPWERLTFPPGTVGRRGWVSEFTVAHRNNVFSVLDRTLESGVRHLAIASLSEIRPTWWEAQRIKDEIAGKDATAIEVYPPQAEIVDDANMYHLWVVPRLPFSLFSEPGA